MKKKSKMGLTGKKTNRRHDLQKDLVEMAKIIVRHKVKGTDNEPLSEEELKIYNNINRKTNIFKPKDEGSVSK